MNKVCLISVFGYLQKNQKIYVSWENVPILRFEKGVGSVVTLFFFSSSKTKSLFLLFEKEGK